MFCQSGKEKGEEGKGVLPLIEIMPRQTKGNAQSPTASMERKADGTTRFRTKGEISKLSKT